MPGEAAGHEQHVASLVDPHPERLTATHVDEHVTGTAAQTAAVDVAVPQRSHIERASRAHRDALGLEVDRERNRAREGRGCCRQREGGGHDDGDENGEFAHGWLPRTEIAPSARGCAGLSPMSRMMRQTKEAEPVSPVNRSHIVNQRSKPVRWVGHVGLEPTTRGFKSRGRSVAVRRGLSPRAGRTSHKVANRRLQMSVRRWAWLNSWLHDTYYPAAVGLAPCRLSESGGCRLQCSSQRDDASTPNSSRGATNSRVDA